MRKQIQKMPTPFIWQGFFRTNPKEFLGVQALLLPVTVADLRPVEQVFTPPESMGVQAFLLPVTALPPWVFGPDQNESAGVQALLLPAANDQIWIHAVDTPTESAAVQALLLPVTGTHV